MTKVVVRPRRRAIVSAIGALCCWSLTLILPTGSVCAPRAAAAKADSWQHTLWIPCDAADGQWLQTNVVPAFAAAIGQAPKFDLFRFLDPYGPGTNGTFARIGKGTASGWSTVDEPHTGQEPLLRQVLKSSVSSSLNATFRSLWLIGHGQGWPGGFPDHEVMFALGRAAVGTSRSSPRSGLPREMLEYAEVAQAITNAGSKLNLLVLVTCFGGCVEMLYEVQGVTDYVVASPTWTTALSIHPKHVLPELQAQPDMPPNALAELLAARYRAGKAKKCTYDRDLYAASAISTLRVPTFTDEFTKVVSELAGHHPTHRRQILDDARAAAVDYGSGGQIYACPRTLPNDCCCMHDLGQVLDRIALHKRASSQLKAYATRARTTLDEIVLCTSSAPVWSKGCGLSIYFPGGTRGLSEYAQHSPFAVATGWARLLASSLPETCEPSFAAVRIKRLAPRYVDGSVLEVSAQLEADEGFLPTEIESTQLLIRVPGGDVLWRQGLSRDAGGFAATGQWSGEVTTAPTRCGPALVPHGRYEASSDRGVEWYATVPVEFRSTRSLAEEGPALAYLGGSQTASGLRVRLLALHSSANPDRGAFVVPTEPGDSIRLTGLTAHWWHDSMRRARRAYDSVISLSTLPITLGTTRLPPGTDVEVGVVVRDVHGRSHTRFHEGVIQVR